MEFLKKHKKFIAWALFFSLVIIPLVIQGLINWDTINKGSDDGWLGFWGGYLGSIIGVIGALIVIQIQLANDKNRFDEETEARKVELEESKKRFDEETQARDKEFEESKKRFDEETETRNKEFEEEKKARKSEQIDNTFFNLLNLFISQQNSLVQEQNLDRDIFENMMVRIREGSAHAYRKQGMEMFYSKKVELLSVIEKVLEVSEDYIEKKKFDFSEEEQLRLENFKKDPMSISKPSNTSNDSFEDAWGEIRRIHCIKSFKRMIEEKHFTETYPGGSETLGIPAISVYIDRIMETDSVNSLNDDSKSFLTNLDKDLNEFLKNRPDIDLSPERKKQVVEDSQESYRKKVGSYFRIFHRIMKYLNENVDDKHIKKNYIGFLRANMNENQMAMIFYNINYTERGSGAIEELKGTGFFGDRSELSDMKSTHFFSPETLVWGDYDLKKMQEFC